ncbi:MAG: SufD family Fe-S cluster assembly protein [Candidatus Shikimatogenerans bostrichidophilus]|nr:MAG: SufD family Fe-S cluster assembly protein [Candidatus Shikimatogenerans bostrichidophilus]
MYLINSKIKIYKNFDINIIIFNNYLKSIYNNKKIKIKIINKNKYLYIYIKNINNKYINIKLLLNFYYFNIVTFLNKYIIKLKIDKKINLLLIEKYNLYGYNLLFNYNIIKLIVKRKSYIKYLKNINKEISLMNKIYIYQKESRIDIYDINIKNLNSNNFIFIKNYSNNCINNIYGIYILNKYQFLKNKIIYFNKFNNCKNNQKFISILNDYTKVILKGIININKNTRNNISYQNYKNYILSNNVYINIKPYLNIYSNNIKCTHGVNMGKIDNNIIYYLLSRGLNILKSKLLYYYSILYENIKDKNILYLIKNKIKKKIKECLIVKK